MANYTDLKVPVFTGINDVPAVPTATKGGNGSHIVSTINTLIDRLSLSEQSSNSAITWNIIESSAYDVTLQPNSKNLLVRSSEEESTLIVRGHSNPVPGDFMTLLKAQPELVCTVVAYPNIQNRGTIEAILETSYEEVTLVYLSEGQGWVLSRNDVFTFPQSGGS